MLSFLYLNSSVNSYFICNDHFFNVVVFLIGTLNLLSFITLFQGNITVWLIVFLLFIFMFVISNFLNLFIMRSVFQYFIQSLCLCLHYLSPVGLCPLHQDILYITSFIYCSNCCNKQNLPCFFISW